MRAIIRDYTRPGDLIVDPFAGSGTTLLAARLEGRRAIGAELDPKTFALAVKRLSTPWTPRLFADQEDKG
jgi:site-specific DNA-methyltransferase (adenine-specific)